MKIEYKYIKGNCHIFNRLQFVYTVREVTNYRNVSWVCIFNNTMIKINNDDVDDHISNEEYFAHQFNIIINDDKLLNGNESYTYNIQQV